MLRQRITRDCVHILNEIENKWKSIEDSKDFINPHNYEYLLNPGRNICGSNGGENLLFLAMVSVKASGFMERQIIRSTWAAKSIASQKFKVVFMVGDSNSDEVENNLR